MNSPYDVRRAARLAAVQALYQMELNNDDAELARTSRSRAWLTGANAGLGVAVAGAATVAVAAVGASAVGDSRLDGILLAGLVFMTMGAFEAVIGLPDAAMRLGACADAAERLEAVTEATPPVKSAQNPRPIAGVAPIEFCEVSLRFDGRDEPAVSDVSFRLDPGSRVALVGASGAGKTTVANLCVRFADPTCGQVTLAGHDVREYGLEDLRRSVRLVSQDAWLFTTTIAANVRLAAPNATDAEIAAALARAGLRDWIDSLPAGIETLVGEEGAEVSSGQRGRIALARGFISPSSTLILDEPTANLHPSGARDLLRTLGEDRTEERAMLVITHTVAGLESFDEILVMDRGRIVERGRWGDLVSSGRRFSQLRQASLGQSE